MPGWTYTKGLHDLGNGCFAYLQPNGGWGWSNAGLIADGSETLLVDTLYDLKLTGEMLDKMRAAIPSASRIGTLVNTHSNADHTFGNQLVADARIIATQKCYDEMKEIDVEARRQELKNWQALGDAGRFQHENLGGNFDFEGIVLTMPTRTFERELDLRVGDKAVKLVEVGPAHTRGDLLVHVPKDKTVFTGDIVFSNGHPPAIGERSDAVLRTAMAGPISNWIRACELIMSWDIETIVPGHGPIVQKGALNDFKAYFEYLTREAKKRFDAGMSVSEAAYDIDLSPFKGWIDEERIIVNVNTLYQDFGATGGMSQFELRTWMGRYRRERREKTPEAGHATHRH